MAVLDAFSLKGKTAVVTGAAGMCGRQMTLALGQAGAKVFVAARREALLREFAAELVALGQDVIPVPCDLGDESSILALRDVVVEQAGGLDILVNNAVLRIMKDGYRDTAEAFDESMHVNATGLFTITRALGDLIAEGGRGGSIINIGSIQGMVGTEPHLYEGTDMHGWYPDYFFHKGGMLNFTRFVASYYGDRGVRCNCVSPGGFQVDTLPEAFVRQYSDHTMLGRLVNDTDLMGVMVFLASDASAYITGANIPVDGGYTAK